MFKPRARRLRSKDAKTIEKIRGFRIIDESARSVSSVVYPTPSKTSPITTHKTPLPTPSPANDNRHIPVWSLTSDAVKVFASCVALQLSGKPAVAFTFNLTPDAIAEAKDSPTGFLDPLKRSFDLELKRALQGAALPYWFAIDVDADGRLHIHGAFAADDSMHPAIREAMKAAWGEWEGPGKHKQLWFSPAPCDDGWATYSMRNQRAVAKIIGARTFTISGLRRDAEWAYSEIRRIMRGGK
jgi:hypothetical protein